MKAYIMVSYRDGQETVELTREKEPPEVWAGPHGWQNVTQAIEVLDRTYQDLRASLLVTLPEEVQRSVPVVARLTHEQAQRIVSASEEGRQL